MEIVPPSEISPHDMALLEPSLEVSGEEKGKILHALQTNPSGCQLWRFQKERSWARLVTVVDRPNIHVWHIAGERLLPHAQYIRSTLLEFAKGLGLSSVSVRTPKRVDRIYRRLFGPADKVEIFSTWEVK